MNLSEIKEKMKKIKGRKIIAKVNIGRNRYEIFEGVLENTYPYLFTIRLGVEIKSFSYADLLTKNVIIKLV